MRATARLRLFQFVEAMLAAAAAYHSLHSRTRAQVEEKIPGVGTYLSKISDGLAEGVCAALAEEWRRSGRYGRGWGM
jgi:hypothetical protein